MLQFKCECYLTLLIDIFEYLITEDMFLTEGKALTESITSVREELIDIKNQRSKNYISTDLNILPDPIFSLSEESNSVPNCYENNDVNGCRLANQQIQDNILPEKNFLYNNISSSMSDGDDMSDVFEDPMSSPEFVRIFPIKLFINLYKIVVGHFQSNFFRM